MQVRYADRRKKNLSPVPLCFSQLEACVRKKGNGKLSVTFVVGNNRQKEDGLSTAPTGFHKLLVPYAHVARGITFTFLLVFLLQLFFFTSPSPVASESYAHITIIILNLFCFNHSELRSELRLLDTSLLKSLHYQTIFRAT
jgi:hypothetical protein